MLFAAREGCLDCVKALVEKGAKIDLPDPEGVTPLISAIFNAHFDVAKYLIEQGRERQPVGLVGPHSAVSGRRLQHAAAWRTPGSAVAR